MTVELVEFLTAWAGSHFIGVKCSTCIEDNGTGTERECWHDARDWPCPEIRDLAAPYDHHPDYRKE